MQLNVRAEPRRQALAPPASSSAGPISFDGVLMRSRARRAASAIRAISAASTPSGGTSRTVGRFVLAVAAEPIGRRARRRASPSRAIMRRIGEAIDAGRQQAGQGAGPERVAGFAALVLEAEHHLRDLPVGRGQRSGICPAWRSKSLAAGELPGLLGELPGDPGPIRPGGENDRNGSGVGGGLERGWHAGLACEGHGYGVAAEAA